MKLDEPDGQGQFNAEINNEFTNAFNEAREARMAFHLIGNGALANATTEHLDAMESLRKHLVLHVLPNGRNPDKTFLKENYEKRKNARDSFLKALNNALDALHA